MLKVKGIFHTELQGSTKYNPLFADIEREEDVEKISGDLCLVKSGQTTKMVFSSSGNDSTVQQFWIIHRPTGYIVAQCNKGAFNEFCKLWQTLGFAHTGDKTFQSKCKKYRIETRSKKFIFLECSDTTSKENG